MDSSLVFCTSRRSLSFCECVGQTETCVCCSEASIVGPSGPRWTAEQRRQVTFTSVWWVLLVCSVCTIFLRGGANTTPLDIRCNACLSECVCCQGSGAGWGESGLENSLYNKRKKPNYETMKLFLSARIGGSCHYFISTDLKGPIRNFH